MPNDGFDEYRLDFVLLRNSLFKGQNGNNNRKKRRFLLWRRERCRYRC